LICAFDLDGTLCSINIVELRMLEHVPDEKFRATLEDVYYREAKPLLDARLFLSGTDEMYIVTSRPERLRYITDAWVKHFYPQAKLFIVDQPILGMTNDPDYIEQWCRKKVELKAKALNDLKVDVYFDDDAEMMDEFRKLCPNVKIVQYGERIKIQ